MVQSIQNGFPGDLVEEHAIDILPVVPKLLRNVPGDGLSFSIGIGGQINVFGVPSVDYSLTDPTNDTNDVWYYATFVNNGSGLYTGFSFYNTISTIKLQLLQVIVHYLIRL
jgi:hypothetical protein